MRRTSPFLLSVVNLAALFTVFSSAAAQGESSPAEQDAPANLPQEIVLEKRTIQRMYDPVEIRADILAGLLGTPLHELVLYSHGNGSLHRIRFQIDEWSEAGSMILDRGVEANAEQGNGLLDANDMLVFMARDAGDRIRTQEWPELQDHAVEIELLDPLTNKKGWTYLARVAQAVPEKRSASSTRVEDAERYAAHGVTYSVVGTNHVIGNKIYKTVMNEHIWVNQEAGGDGKDFIDRSKVRMSARLLFGTITIGFNEDDFIGEVSKYKIGPVRSVARQWASLTMPLGLKSPKFYGDVYVYDTLVLIVAATKVTINPKYLLTDYRMVQGYDLHPETACGMRWYNSNNTAGFLVDGIPSPEEKHADDASDEWRCIVGPNGWMLHRSQWDDFYRSQAEIKVRYSDDLKHKDPPEYYPGDLGYYAVESTVKSLKPRTYSFQLEWYWPYNFYDDERLKIEEIERIMNIRDHPIRVRVRDQEVISSGPRPSLLDP